MGRHYAVSTLRALATVLPERPRSRAAVLLNGLGPATGTLVDDWTAKPTATHPRPVVLIHGTNDTSAVFGDLARALRDAGHAVFAVDYGHETRSIRGRAGGGGTADLRESAREIAAFIDKVLETTDAERVDLVGHSQGGLHAHAYAKGAGDIGQTTTAYPGADRVGRVVTLGSTVHGASPLGPGDPVGHLRPIAHTLDAFLGPSARQQLRGSDVIAWLARTPDAAPGVAYTSIVSRFDHSVRPPAAQHLDEGPGVRNVWVQDVAPGSRVGHAQMPRDPDVIALVLDALR